ncbi:MIP/aquaporin family protein KNAG_0J02910 [Huiozyma naganishii CBS 8797]|uniref:Uncharacterized protein n=1 Tax=Huiozyma naganishii (strain ATCC MYA-139 / BCRC 22969 / CBS 8797 / KCTC 17520 / NBRC 10181 / NCYC 3082 / Yp74L-3) TaxID=1071383 RepID=J7RBU0_HUIN7|nr:hypothetical protein KNAG_0J02910 [Kazachstania naganishii CBS 8797]CCK72370.1 hypothetical protein KNAG_0J02910 [Kazachstania naganishii CBS 8797]
MSNTNEALNEFLKGDVQSEPSLRSHERERSAGRGSKDENFDYERQDTPGRHASQSPTSALPSASYIPQYTMDGQMPFPIQEVIPNTQVTMSTAVDSQHHNSMSKGNSNGGNSGLRARTPTVTANVLNVGDFYNDRDTINNNSNGNINNSNGNGNGNGNDNEHNSDGGADDSTYHDDGDAPLNVPLLVKPKTLYQNPQTPTVLPSTYHPINKWSAVKQSYMKEFLAEFLGTLVMCLLGSAVCCQVNLGARATEISYNDSLNKLTDSLPTSLDDAITIVRTLQELVTPSPSGSFDAIPLGWGAAVVMGYFCSGGSAISGAHLNPSVTISNLVFRGFPLKKVPFYLCGQILGAFAGALITFIFYKRVFIELYSDWHLEQAVAADFITFPKPYLSSARQFTSEYVATAVFQACIFAMTDPYTCLSTDVFPLMLFILIFILNASMGYTTACAINLARDLGPRLALYAVGMDRKLLWIRYHHYFWVPITAPIFGALTGALVYDICVYQGHESPVNWPWTVYKEKFWKYWMRRPSWMYKKRERATSDLSEFSYAPDDDDYEYNMEDYGAGESNGILKKGKAKTKAKHQNSDSSDIDEEVVNKAVTFKSVQKRDRGYGGIPTILEEDGGTSFIEDGDSMMMSTDSSSLPNFVSTTNDEK